MPDKSKRENTKKSNRDKILIAARKVFGEKGLDGTNVRDIIRGSKLSTGTFYNYFKSKEEIFDVILDEIILDIHNKSRETWLKVWKSGAGDITKGFEEFFNIFQNNPDYLHFFSKNQRHVRELRYNGKISGILASLEGDIEEAIKEGKLPSFPVRFVTILLFGCVFEFLADMIITPGSINIKETSENLSAFFRGGILSLSVNTGVQKFNQNILSLANLPINMIGNIINGALIKKTNKPEKKKKAKKK
ncbi:MAG: TetR/AcrR family transcriptional regulator [Leptospiraceae bacterium]|nr:TetR/AcrR family transcriptional regulator [Leptospiraceae bacterium]